MTSSLSGAAVIAAAWPARYYAAYDVAATGVTLVTALYDVQSELTLVQKLPAASTMIALTEAQWDLATGATHIWVQNGALLYPDRYYAAYDTTAVQPTIVTGWYDTWGMTSVANVPPVSRLIAVSAEDWTDVTRFRLSFGRGVKDGAVIDYTPPAPPVPLKTQAATTLAVAATKTWAKFGSKRIDVPQAWVDYQIALEAIEDGSDTTSTELPAEPST